MTQKTNSSGFSEIGYSPPIDGLRAVAVISVIAYHAYSKLLPSGLIGVDIFFVISGFVVSGSVLSRSFKGAGDLLTFFFARRILRIAPALLICLLVTTAATIAFIPQAYLSDTNLTTALGAFFGVSNIVLYRSSDSYFAPRAELNPFTHTWSLAVEEQFYLLFPLLAVGVLFVCGRRWSRTAAVLAGSGLTAASVLVARHHSIQDPAAAFYLSPARFWELGAGVLAFLLLPQVLPLLARLPGRAIDAIALAGLCGVAASVKFASAWATTYPFPEVVPAVVSGVVLIVALVACPQGVVAAALGQNWVVYIGRISYSLYLWHWPVFVLMRWTSGFSSFLQVATGIALSCLLAMASYHWIEVPIRSGQRQRTWRVATICCGVACLGIAAGSVKWATTHQPELSASLTSDRYVWHPEGATRGLEMDCGLTVKAENRNDGVGLDFLPVNCSRTKTRRTIFVAGDSHAGAMIRVFVNAVTSQGATVRLDSLPGCGVLTLIAPLALQGAACETYVKDTFANVIDAAKPGDVLFLPSLRLQRLQSMDGEEILGSSDQMNAQTPPSVMLEAEGLLRKLNEHGIYVVFSAPLPIFRTAPYRCSDWFNRHNPVCRNGFDVPRDEIEALRAGVMLSMKRLSQEFPYVSVWDPVPALCDAKVCSAMKDGKPLFFDGDHLSGWGNDVVFPSFMAHIDRLPGLGVAANQSPQ